MNRIRNITVDKVQRRLHHYLVSFVGRFAYPAYWHYKLYGISVNSANDDFYYSARPNPGAGIGHQIANWIAGFHYAKFFGLKFAHIPFSTHEWENFLGFGVGEEKVDNLKKKGYLIRKLPLFHDGNSKEIELNKKIMSSYGGKKIVFVAEQDQFLRNLPMECNDLQRKFFSATSRMGQILQYDKDHFNIAIHVRRGDIMADPKNSNLAMRFLSNDYFEKVLTNVVEMVKLKISKPIHIFFFSQGLPKDYPEFQKFQNLHWCMDWDAQKSFLHMVYADVLITSKSSFSYKPALLNQNIKVCPKNFWHSYPQNDANWILCDYDGSFDANVEF
ncbi:hypothetical protein IKQ19_18540 [Candidatus Saccharibacteria bacterium]|nr:hypothetical protein [Candidatus Saccharibacteria bacterium]